MIAYSPRYDQALAFAAQAHHTQLRKGTSIPYIAHVVHVSVILMRHGFSEDLAVAGLLHDVIEDCGVEAATVAAQFGAEVARLVVAVSEPKGTVSWEAAKTAKIAFLATGGPDVAALKAADAIHNVQSILADLDRIGDAIWSRFKRGAQPTLWYYNEIVAKVQQWLPTHPITAELVAVVARLDERIRTA